MQKKDWWQRSFATFLMRLAFGLFFSGALFMIVEKNFGTVSWLAGSILQIALLLFAIAFYFGCVESLVLHRFTLELWLSATMAVTTFWMIVSMM